MAWYPQVDSKALEQAILRELQRQGIEFAQVKFDPFLPSEKHVSIHLHTEDRLNPKYVETVRVSNQIKTVEVEKP
jgi:histidinol phosphatase-like enzyme